MSDGVMEMGAIQRETEETPSVNTLIYSDENKPPWGLAMLLGLQHFVTAAATAMCVPFVLGTWLCFLDHDPGRGYLLSTIFLVSGFSTLIQCFFGSRLPILQGPSLIHLTCIVTLVKLPQFSCPTDVDLYAMGPANRTGEWQDRVRELQGAVISVSLLEVLIGYTGLMGFLVGFITPVTIAPTMIMLGLSMGTFAADMSSSEWPVAVATVLIIIFLLMCLGKLPSPLPWYTISKGWHVQWKPVFRLFPFLLAVFTISMLCAILNAHDVLEADTYRQNNFQVMEYADWFWIPYPFQWGLPRFTTRSIILLAVALWVSIVKATGDHYTCRSVCGDPPPSACTVSRAVGAEGLCCLIAGLFGSGLGVSPNTDNTASIAISKVGSRREVLCGAVIMTLISFFPKLGAFFTLIPTAVLGGLLGVLFTMVTAVGFSSLQFTEMKSRRNLLILGASLCFGVAIPRLLKKHAECFATGYNVMDDFVIALILSNEVVLTSLLAFSMDLVLPGASGSQNQNVCSCSLRSNVCCSIKSPLNCCRRKNDELVGWN